MIPPSIDVIASAREYVKRNEVRYGDAVAYHDKGLMVKRLLEYIDALRRSPSVNGPVASITHDMEREGQLEFDRLGSTAKSVYRTMINIAAPPAVASPALEQLVREWRDAQKAIDRMTVQQRQKDRAPLDRLIAAHNALIKFAKEEMG